MICYRIDRASECPTSYIANSRQHGTKETQLHNTIARSFFFFSVLSRIKARNAHFLPSCIYKTIAYYLYKNENEKFSYDGVIGLILLLMHYLARISVLLFSNSIQSLSHCKCDFCLAENRLTPNYF